MSDVSALDQAIQRILDTARSRHVAIGTKLEAGRLSEAFGLSPDVAEERLVGAAKAAGMGLHVLPPAKFGG